MRAVLRDDLIVIYDSYYYKESIKEIEGRFFDADEKAWCVPLSTKNIARLKLLGADLSAELQEMDEGNVTCDTLEEPIIRPPIKGSLYQHQVRAYNFALKTLGVRRNEK